MLYSRALSGNLNLLLHYEGREFGVSVGGDFVFDLAV